MRSFYDSEQIFVSKGENETFRLNEKLNSACKSKFHTED